MATILGRLSSIKLGTDVVLQMNSWGLSIEDTPVEKAFFLESWSKIHGIALQKWSATLEGSVHKTDATGQNILRAAAAAATRLTDLKLFVDDASYWASAASDGAYIVSYAENSERGDLVNVSISIGGDGEIEYNAV